MEAIRIRTVVKKDGEILVTKLPYKRGQRVEMILLAESSVGTEHSGLKASRLLRSEIIGLWKDREDIEDSVVYARQLREQAQRR